MTMTRKTLMWQGCEGPVSTLAEAMPTWEEATMKVRTFTTLCAWTVLIGLLAAVIWCWYMLLWGEECEKILCGL